MRIAAYTHHIFHRSQSDRPDVGTRIFSFTRGLADASRSKTLSLTDGTIVVTNHVVKSAIVLIVPSSRSPDEALRHTPHVMASFFPLTPACAHMRLIASLPVCLSCMTPIIRIYEGPFRSFSGNRT